MRKHRGQLPIPTAVTRDAQATEILRVWASDGMQVVTLAPDLWEDPVCWGVMLVDLAKHIANAYSQSKGMSRSEAIERLKAGFDAEWETETDNPTGGIVDN